MLTSALILATCGPAAPSPPRRATPTHRTRPPKPRNTVRPDVLPIPEDHGAIRLDLARLRRTAVYRKVRPHLIALLARKKHRSRLAYERTKRCGFDLERDVMTLSIAIDLRESTKPEIVVVRTRVDAQRLLRCLAGQTQPPFAHKRIHLGPLRGVAWYEKGSLTGEVLVLDKHRLVWMGPRSRVAVREVLTGSRRSLASTLLYRAIRGSQTSAPMAMAVLPVLQEAKPGQPLPFIADLLALGIGVDLPRGGLRLRGLVPCGKTETANTLVRMMPMMGAMLAKKSPAYAPVLRKLKLTLDSDDPTAVRVALDLSGAEVAPLLVLLDKTLKAKPGSKPPSRP